MNCPVCKKIKLVRTDYEGIRVRHCLACEGYLVQRPRLNAIRNNIEKSDEEFMEEIASVKAVDSIKNLRCPSCTRAMSKKRSSIGPENYFIDECTHCPETWFDGGELAKLQLQYEESDKGAEMLRFRERLATMTIEERAELDQRIANLGNAKIFDRRDYVLLARLLLR